MIKLISPVGGTYMRRFLAIVATLLITSSSLAKGDKTTDPLKKVLASAGYFMAYPANNWTYAGGFLVANTGGATFISLPKEVSKPETESAKATFPATDTTR